MTSYRLPCTLAILLAASGLAACAAPGDGPGDGCEPVAESCNGVDDDCDGLADEELVGAGCPLQAGVCDGSTASCGGDAGWLACGPSEYGADYEATETLCDGLDNDCNGTADTDAFPSLGSECIEGSGVCLSVGAWTCLAGGSGLTCSATPGVAGTEACGNGLDDDCDAQTDEPQCTCSSDVQCASDQFCEFAACVPKLTLGVACSRTGQCATGFCADDVCCDTSCAGLCKSCSGLWNDMGDGNCSNISCGDPDDECGGAAMCTGAGTCGSACL